MTEDNETTTITYLNVTADGELEYKQALVKKSDLDAWFSTEGWTQVARKDLTSYEQDCS